MAHEFDKCIRIFLKEEKLIDFLKLVDFPDSNWKLFIVIVAIINVIVTFLYEKVVAIHLTLYWRRYRERKELEKTKK